MIDKKKNRKSIRLKGFDYSTPWWYYVTICTKSHKNDFAFVINKKIELSEIGNIAKSCWEEIPNHNPIVKLDYFVVMPNHINGIIVIDETGRDVKLNLPTIMLSYNDVTSIGYYSKISPSKNSLSVIIRTYKAAVTSKCRKLGFIKFQWQSNYYDRIIRNEKELFQIRKYIEQNPLRWELEKNIPDNIDF